jgi:ribosomal protection tetracycline resistance protein
LFVNKIDRAGADPERTLEAIEEKLTPAVVPMGSAAELGTRAASFASFGPPDDDLAERARAGELHPVFFGSALTGAGIAELMDAIARLLPADGGDPDGPLSGRVFKIERGTSGDRIAYARLFSGTVSVRDRLENGKVTALAVFEDGDAKQRQSAQAGEIARLWGLGDVRIGDWLGTPRTAVEHHFAPPTLESVVDPRDPADRNSLRVALNQLAEQDPLIAVRQDDRRQELSVSLYGEVQKEVIESTLATDYGLEVEFRQTTTICIERPVAPGEAVEMLNTPTNPFHADLGLRIEPAAPGAGIEVRVDVDPRDAPLYVFKTFESFVQHIDEYIRLALEEGLYGWQVSDCVVTLTTIGYSLADGPPSRRGPMPTAGDLKKLTPVVLLQALRRGGSAVCEPVVRIRVEMPTEAIGPVLAALGRLGAAAGTPWLRGDLSVLETVLPAARVQDLRRQLPGLTGGEGVLESDFAGYEPVTGEPPTRGRTTPNPLNFDEYVYAVGRT